MIQWVQKWSWYYDLSLINAGVCFATAIVCIWVTQCMVTVPRAPWWALWSILAHRAMLLLLAGALALAGAAPYLDFGAPPDTSDVITRTIILLMLLVWPASSRARRRFGPHV